MVKVKITWWDGLVEVRELNEKQLQILEREKAREGNELVKSIEYL